MMENKDPDKLKYIALSSIILWFFLAGAILLYFEGVQPLFLVTIALIALMAFLGLASRTLFRPGAIDIGDQGIILYLPLGRQRTIKWERIIRISTTKIVASKKEGFFHAGGTIVEKDRVRPTDLTSELALLIKDEYQKRFGDKVTKIWKEY
jgi:hypothetical protein